ncbi:MBL fold metallo-hydrolase [Chloroflexota bacterium]
MRRLRSQYGSVLDFYEESGFIKLKTFHDKIEIGNIQMTAIPVGRDSRVAFVYVFEKSERRVVYAPCDIKPFPEHRDEVQNADLLIIQPGIFVDGLKHGFKYPVGHISRTTLYTFKQTVELAIRLQARKVVFVHLEEYWNRSYDDYHLLEAKNSNIHFAYDGMELQV